MKGFALLSAFAALVAFASASHHRSHFTLSNGTHFVDPHTKQTVRHFGCDVHRGHASDHFLKTIKKLHDKHKHSNVGTRAALPAARRKGRPKKKQTSAALQSATTQTSSSSPTAAAQAPPAGITISTYFHVISSTAAANAGTITQDMVNQQIGKLNTAYNPHGIEFTLVNTSFTTNDAWAVAAGSDMDAAKAALRTGTYSSLNIYFHTDLAGGNLGTCTLPSQVPPGATAQTYLSDGCNVNANTMPGGTMMGYNQGMTAVHETGHWLGLLHTFEGYSCDGDGDMIVDTRMEAQSTNGCPADPAKNTCPSLPGVDPIHNYMDYSTDACYESFSDGQVARMQALWTQYRKGN